MTSRLLTVREAADRRIAGAPFLDDRPPRTYDRFIYVIQHLFTGAMKVGFSYDPYRRVGELTKVFNEFTKCVVVAATYGSRDEEQAIHRYLRPLSVRAPNCIWSGSTEWFLPGGCLIHIAHYWGLPDLQHAWTTWWGDVPHE